MFMPMALSLDAFQLSHLTSECLHFLLCKCGITVVRTLLECPMHIPSIRMLAKILYIERETR